MTGDDGQRLEYDKISEHPRVQGQGQEQEQQEQVQQKQQEQGKQVRNEKQVQQGQEMSNEQQEQEQKEQQQQEQQLQQQQQEEGQNTRPAPATTFDSTTSGHLDVTVTAGASDDGILEDGSSQDSDKTLARANSSDTGDSGQGKLPNVGDRIDGRAEGVGVAAGTAKAAGAEDGEQDVKRGDEADLDVDVVDDDELEEIKV